MTKLISVDQFRKEAAAGAQPTGGVFRVSTVTPKAFEDGSRKVRFCFSDGSIDRMGDTIDPNGWDTADFDRNPVALWAHDSSAPPIGRASGVAVEGKRLMGNIEFCAPEVYEFADTIFKLVSGGFLNAVSVGFLPTEYAFVDNDPKRGHGVDFKSQILLEISVCPIPANPQALVQARAAGIDTVPLISWAEKLLDGGGSLLISKTELNALRKAAKGPTMAKRTTGAVLRADDDEDKPKATCGRSSDEECGMKSNAECAVHAGAKSADDAEDSDEKTLRRLLMKLLAPKRRADDDKPDGDEPPLAHEDSIRMAHKALRTAKAFMTEGMTHHNKAVDLLGDVVDALNDAPDESDDKSENPDADPDADPDSEKAAQLRRAAALKQKHRA